MDGRALAVFLATYGACLAALLPRLSLWLDEVLDLIGARKETLQQVWEYAARNAGGVPLGYFYAFLSIRTFGYSVSAGRLPSLVASLAACAGIFLLARRLGMRYPLIAVAIFALVPLQFRYAMEARPYGPALAIAIWSTVVFLQLLDAPGFRRAELYGLLVAAGLFTQVYSIFIPVAHVVWLFLDRRDARALRYVVLPFALACACFLPWYFYGVPFWKAEIATYAIHPQFNFKEAQLIFKELVGMGYAGTIVMLIFGALGLRSLSPGKRMLWVLLVAVPIIGAVTANLALGYFLAIRQVIYVLLPLSLLAALCIEELLRSGKPVEVLLVAALAGLALFEDARLFTRPRENWEAAAALLAEESTGTNCVISVPSSSWELYQFFQPKLLQTSCLDNEQSYSSIVVAVSPYESQALLSATVQQFQSHGWMRIGERTFNGPRILYFSHAK